MAMFLGNVIILQASKCMFLFINFSSIFQLWGGIGSDWSGEGKWADRCLIPSILDLYYYYLRLWCAAAETYHLFQRSQMLDG